MPDREEQPRRKAAVDRKPIHKDWHSGHIKSPRTSFISKRHVPKMWKL